MPTIPPPPRACLQPHEASARHRVRVPGDHMWSRVAADSPWIARTASGAVLTGGIVLAGSALASAQLTDAPHSPTPNPTTATVTARTTPPPHNTSTDLANAKTHAETTSNTAATNATRTATQHRKPVPSAAQLSAAATTDCPCAAVINPTPQPPPLVTSAPTPPPQTSPNTTTGARVYLPQLVGKKDTPPQQPAPVTCASATTSTPQPAPSANQQTPAPSRPATPPAAQTPTPPSRQPAPTQPATPSTPKPEHKPALAQPFEKAPHGPRLHPGKRSTPHPRLYTPPTASPKKTHRHTQKKPTTKKSTRAASAPTHKTAVLEMAKNLSGIPYVWGGTSTSGFDCSGFTQHIFRKAGISLPRTAAQQQAATTHIKNPKPGDLVFFGSPAHHVGIYAGNGYMYDAPRSGRTTGLHKIWSSKVTYHRAH